jgi:predicted ATPase
MKIQQCRIENFTVFERSQIEFCPGVNVLIGANGTGKSHLLKILYSMAQAVPGKPQAAYDGTDVLRLYGVLLGVFKPEEEVDAMIRTEDRKTPAVFHMESDRGHHYAELRRNYHLASLGGLPPNEHAAGLFIPPNEVLAIYPGFAASYDKRELAFDQTYYDLCKALAAAPLRQRNPIFSGVVGRLEDILHGKVIQKGDRFYVQSRSSGKTLEAHLLAEGHRKIAAVLHLINNGSIDEGTVLFWDEPEANLNPRLTCQIALFLRELAKAGIQVFIASHDYLLTNELSMAAEYQTEPEVPIRFFAMSKEGRVPVTIESGDTLSDVRNNPILDEFAAHYEREQTEVVRFMHARNSL